MSFRSEFASNQSIILGLTESGQGKATGAYTLLPHLSDHTQIIHPSDGGLLTQVIWQYADSVYRRRPTRPGNDGADNHGVHEWKI